MGAVACALRTPAEPRARLRLGARRWRARVGLPRCWAATVLGGGAGLPRCWAARPSHARARGKLGWRALAGPRPLGRAQARASWAARRARAHEGEAGAVGRAGEREGGKGAAGPAEMGQGGDWATFPFPFSSSFLSLFFLFQFDIMRK
jgi:hypothetical protein